MSLRVRKLIGLVGILVFILAYMGLMIRAAQYVPDHGPWQFIFYALAGVSWGIPILPMISWMNRGR
ncbi:DUF2842 domain-containing protein [Phenylobacterium sp.]|uniref:DUF2842 domain-containing protein n=1 Tax=Phenylobacterium sp. TaxID=1871053 RepID=UPI00286CB562|nr:DUF2842 domain-containing protein [Phenylobacterium sp.]